MILGKTYLGSTEIQKVYLGSDVVYEAGGGGTELYGDDNAASPSDLDSIGATTGGYRWSASGSTIESTNLDAYDGTYSLLLTTTGTGASYAQYRVLATSGKDYKITFRYKVDSYNTQRFRVIGGFTTSQTDALTSTTWQEFTTTVTSSTTGSVSFYFYSGFFGNIGDELWVDQMSIIELN